MRLIDADKFKENVLSNLYIYLQVNKEDIAKAIDDEPTITPDFKLFKEWKCADCEEREKAYCQGFNMGSVSSRPQGEWFDCIEAGTLKARHGDYVLYKVDFLLDNLTREVYIMEGARRMRGEEND